MHRVKIGALTAIWSRVAVSIAVVALAAVAAAGFVGAEPTATQVITAVPVGPNGEPINGYQMAPSQGNVDDVADCTTPSTAAVGDDIYYCSPSAASADVCWPSMPDPFCAGMIPGTKSYIG